MSWVKPRDLPSFEAIKFQGNPCTTQASLWEALDKTFNSAQDRPYCTDYLTEITPLPSREWLPLTDQELLDALKPISNRSALGLDHITWRYLKRVFKDSTIRLQILAYANSCVTIGHWPSYFKESKSVLIPKPGKAEYTTPKSF